MLGVTLWRTCQSVALVAAAGVRTSQAVARVPVTPAPAFHVVDLVAVTGVVLAVPVSKAPESKAVSSIAGPGAGCGERSS